jgi:hypothetical protein
VLKEQEAWISDKGRKMHHIRGRLGRAKTVVELHPVVDEVLSLSEEWRSMIRSNFYAPDE